MGGTFVRKYLPLKELESFWTLNLPPNFPTPHHYPPLLTILHPQLPYHPRPQTRLSSLCRATQPAWTICSVLPPGQGSAEGGQDALAGSTLFMFPLPHPGKPRVPTLTEAGRSPRTPHLSGLLTNYR